MPRNGRTPASLRGVQLSIVVPLFNEVATLAELHRLLNEVLQAGDTDPDQRLEQVCERALDHLHRAARSVPFG